MHGQWISYKNYLLIFVNYYTLKIVNSFFRFGRKTTLLVSVTPMIAGWILLLDANTVFELYVARILWGITLGIVHSVVLPMYLGEIGSDKIRGSISIILGVMGKTGIFFMYAVGPFVTIFTMAWIQLIPLAIFLLIFFWLPESPYYLLGKNRRNDALNSLCRLRGHENVEDELSRMDALVKRSQDSTAGFKEIFAMENRRGLIIIFGLSTAIILTGTEAILSFSQLIFDKIGLPGNMLIIILGGLLVSATIVASFVVDRIGRRPMLLGSTVGLAVCNTAIAIIFALMENKVDISHVKWIPVLALMLYVVSYGMGLATVTFAVMGEIIPKHLKAVAGTIFGITVSALSLIVSKLFQVAADSVGHSVIFAAFAFFSFLFLPFVWYLIPETKGKSLDTILNELSKF